MEQEKTHIIWDLSGTLFKPMKTGLTLQELADLSLVFYMWSGKNEPSKLDLFALEVLNQAQESLPEYQVIRLATGAPVPAVQCSLLAGLIDSQEACQEAMEAIPKVKNDGLTKEELVQVCRMLKTFFNPLALAHCMRPIPETENLVNRAAQNPHNQLYVLSNWDRESFAVFFKTESAQNGLHNFKRKNILISADIGYIKPQPEMYELFLAHYKLDPKTCFFIDDQEENIVAAQTFGIDGVQFKEKDPDGLQQKFIQLGIIS